MSNHVEEAWEAEKLLIPQVLSPAHYKLQVVLQVQLGKQEELCVAITDAHKALAVADEKERYILLSYMTQPESSFLRVLLKVLEKRGDAYLLGSVCGLLQEALCPTKSAEARQTLLQCLLLLNANEVLLKMMKTVVLTEGVAKFDVYLVQTVQVLAKLASRDPKFPLKARLFGAVKLCHNLLQISMKSGPTYILPLLILLKQIARNPTNQVTLGKEGCIATLISALNSLPKTQWAKQKLIFECLAILTKTKTNVVRIVKENGLQRFCAILDCSDKIEKRHKLKLLKALLSALSHLCDSKHGRKALLNMGGSESLYRFATCCPQDKKFEPVLTAAINVFLKCASRSDLPITSIRSPIFFNVPSYQRESSPASIGGYSREVTPDPDQETTSDEEREMDLLMDENESILDLQGIDLACEYNPQTTRLDDLMRMSIFFPELKQLNTELNNLPSTEQKHDITDSHFEQENIDNSEPLCQNDVYINTSTNTRSIIEFVKIPYPDLIGAQGPPYAESITPKDWKVCREKYLRTAARVLNTDTYNEKVVYDLDFFITSQERLITPSIPKSSLNNYDKKRIGHRDLSSKHLNFESRFESGNLRRAIQVAPYEYDLLLNPDVNSSHYHQWFYFEVFNMEKNIPYIFNIINNEKVGSEFNSGMKPVMFSVTESILGCPFWTRTGFDICYHKNHYVRQIKNENLKFQKNTGKCYYTATFTVKFPHSYDVCYLAYHYPYTYTRLQSLLMSLEKQTTDIVFHNQLLCQSLNGNKINVLTITNPSISTGPRKETIFLSARVHPGESGASWMMEGALRFLTGASEKASALRDKFVFKIVPMLNPEGVINGNQRCGLTDEDLNRRWRSPKPHLQPSIYYTKALIEYLTSIIGRRPLVFCDFHGHSNQKNIFMYGCSNRESWWSGDTALKEEKHYLVIPQLANRCMKAFSIRDCRFHVERSKEGTARVVLWRQFKVPMAYTVEASTNGCDQGPLKDCHLNPQTLLEAGEGFCLALYYLNVHSTQSDYLQLPNLNKPEEITHKEVPISTMGKLSEEVLDSDENFDSDIDLDLDLFGYRT